jgi:hypothetical protein
MSSAMQRFGIYQNWGNWDLDGVSSDPSADLVDIFIVFYSIHEVQQQQRLGTAYTNSVTGVRTLRVVGEGYNRSDTKPFHLS